MSAAIDSLSALQAKQTQAEDKASQLAEQLAQLKTQKAAAESRNLVLERVFELQDPHAVHRRRLDDGNSATSSSAARNDAVTEASSDIPRQLCVCKPTIHNPVDLETLQRAHQEQSASMLESQAPMRFTQTQLNLEWGDFAKSWKEFISRYCLPHQTGGISCFVTACTLLRLLYCE